LYNPSAYTESLVWALHGLSYCLELLGDHDGALRNAEGAIAILRRLKRRNLDLEVNALVHLVKVLMGVQVDKG